ncbi:MAG: GNAT family N-acetyltransferase [Stackebrandtia sp.]
MLSLPLDDDTELRTLEPWHHRQLADFADRARDFVGPWLSWVTTIVDEDSAKQWLHDRAVKRAEDRFHMWGLWHGDRLVGGVVYRIFDTYDKVCEIGAWLAPEATGRGLMTKACVHIIDWAFIERGMNRVEWRCETANAASRSVAERLGMTLDGTLRQSYRNARGEYADDEVWSMLADEWKAPPNR